MDHDFACIIEATGEKASFSFPMPSPLSRVSLSISHWYTFRGSLASAFVYVVRLTVPILDLVRHTAVLGAAPRPGTGLTGLGVGRVLGGDLGGALTEVTAARWTAAAWTLLSM